MESSQISPIFSKLGMNITCYNYLKKWQAPLAQYSFIKTEIFNELINTPLEKPVEQSSCPTPMLVLAVWTRFWICKTSLPNRLTFFLENLTSLAKNKYMCGRFNRWINSVFQMISKNMGRETESELSRPSLFHRSEARSTKIVLSGGTFRLSWVSQPIKSVLMNESWMFEYDTRV